MAKKFAYKKRSATSLEKRANSDGGRDNVFNPSFKTYTPKEGDNLVRIMPPTWEDPDHYGLDIFLNYQIGADKNQYLSLSKMKGVPDPIDEERAEADAAGDADFAKSLRPSQRILVWVIDRDAENEGPKLWSMPRTLDADLVKLSKNKRTGAIFAIDDPEEGYDIEFTKTGKALNTKYTGLQIDRNSTPLSDDDDQLEEWLNFIVENPLPSVLIFHDYDHIKRAMSGQKLIAQRASESKDDDDDDKKSKRSRRDKPKKAKVTRDSLAEMDMDELDEFCENEDLNLFGDNFKTVKEFAEAIGDEMDLD